MATKNNGAGSSVPARKKVVSSTISSSSTSKGGSVVKKQSKSLNNTNGTGSAKVTGSDNPLTGARRGRPPGSKNKDKDLKKPASQTSQSSSPTLKNQSNGRSSTKEDKSSTSRSSSTKNDADKSTTGKARIGSRLGRLASMGKDFANQTGAADIAKSAIEGQVRESLSDNATNTNNIDNKQYIDQNTTSINANQPGYGGYRNDHINYQKTDTVAGARAVSPSSNISSSPGLSSDDSILLYLDNSVLRMGRLPKSNRLVDVEASACSFRRNTLHLFNRAGITDPRLFVKIVRSIFDQRNAKFIEKLEEYI